MKFKIGDIVKHKTGGPEMIIERISAFGGVARCSWWCGREEDFQEIEFPVAVLRRVA